jgi:hypothetical protein
MIEGGGLLTDKPNHAITGGVFDILEKSPNKYRTE